MTDTATTIGYKKWLVTCSDTPSEAMIKANSPICVKLKPHCMAVFSGCPASSTPSVPKRDCPRITAKVITTIGPAYSTIMAGSTIMPTDTKKMAPNKSLTGFTSRSILSASTVSARMEPMMKAPKAAEKPVCAAITTIPKQSPRETISKVSSLISFRHRFSNPGMRYIPTTNQSIKKNSSLAMLPSISVPSKLWLTAIVESITINTMARISSRISTLSTSPVNCFLRIPKSSNAL